MANLLRGRVGGQYQVWKSYDPTPVGASDITVVRELGEAVWSADAVPSGDSTYVRSSSYERGGASPFTVWNRDNIATYTSSSYGLQINQPASSGKVAGFIQALPAVAGSHEFSVTMKWPFEGAPRSPDSSVVMGVVLGRNLINNPASGSFVHVGLNHAAYPYSTGNAVFMCNFTNRSTYGVTLRTFNFTEGGAFNLGLAEYSQAAPGSMVRVSVDKNFANYTAAISTDGEVWIEIWGPRALGPDLPAGIGGSLDTIGLLTYSDTNIPRSFRIPWWRYRQGTSGVYRNYSPEGGLI